VLKLSFTDHQAAVSTMCSQKCIVLNSGVRCSTFLFFTGVGLSPLGNVATSGLLNKPQMIDEGDCGAIGGMKIGSGNRSTQRKHAPAPLCPPQTPHDQTRARTRATSSTVG
jgi:hypothetical protein